MPVLNIRDGSLHSYMAYNHNYFAFILKQWLQLLIILYYLQLYSPKDLLKTELSHTEWNSKYKKMTRINYKITESTAVTFYNFSGTFQGTS